MHVANKLVKNIYNLVQQQIANLLSKRHFCVEENQHNIPYQIETRLKVLQHNHLEDPSHWSYITTQERSKVT